MKGVILAGGTGSRLYPITKATNKHLLPVGPFPMICYPVYKLLECGIREILVITGKDHIGGIVKLLGSGRELGASFFYRVQEKAGGIADALGLAETFCRGERIVVLLGDNIFEDSLRSYVESFQKQPRGARVLLKEVADPERFGIAEVAGERITSLEEKPSRPKSNLCVSGIYMYDERVFSLIRHIRPSARGEMEITDVNLRYLQAGELYYDVLQGWWTDAGTFPSLHKANELVKNATFVREMAKRFARDGAAFAEGDLSG